MSKFYGTIDADVFEVKPVLEERTFYGLSGDDVFLLQGKLVDIHLQGGNGYDVVRLQADTSISFFENVWNFKCEMVDFKGHRLSGTASDDNFDLSGFKVIGQTSSINLLGDDDRFVGSSAKDMVDGGAGDDFILGGGGNDIFWGNAGADYLEGGDGLDKLYGGADRDELVGNGDADILNGDSGSDTLDGGDGNDKIYGGDGDDEITGGTGDDLIVGGAGNDLINCLSGTDTVVAGSGNDIIHVNAMPTLDLLRGGSGTDTLFLGIRSGVQNLVISKEQSIEVLETGQIRGTDTNNLFDLSRIKRFENTGLASLLGGNDIYIGSRVDEQIDGGSGNDLLTGGGGNDIFYFSTKLGSKNVDRITDFDVAHDLISLESNIFGNGAFHYQFDTSGRASSTGIHVIYETDTGKLYYDADGKGGHAALLFAELDANLALTSANFI